MYLQHTSAGSRTHKGFSLIEILVVIAIIGLLASVMMPAFNAIGRATSVSASASDVSALLEGARAHAMAQSTYTWVGFFQESSQANSPSSGSPRDQAPPYTARGRVVVAAVASLDGSQVAKTSSALQSGRLPDDRVTMLSKPLKIDHVQMVELPDPAGGKAGTLDGRAAPSVRISASTSEKSLFPFRGGNYVFYKTIRFSPRGEAVVVVGDSTELVPVIELALESTRGDQADPNPQNRAVVQINGASGNVSVFQK